MKTAQLHKESYPKLLIIRLLVGLIRFLFDIPAFFVFLITGRVGSRPRS
jgi:hypothetical protein